MRIAELGANDLRRISTGTARRGNVFTASNLPAPVASTDMLPETSAFSRTLGGVTKIKLDAVTVKQAAFVGLKTHILEKIATETAPLARVQILIDGYKGIGTLGFTNAYETIEFNDSIQNYTRLVEHAKLDPSVGDGVLASWEKALIRGLEVDHSKLQYAGLFGDLLKEWLGSDSDGLKVCSGNLILARF